MTTNALCEHYNAPSGSENNSTLSGKRSQKRLLNNKLVIVSILICLSVNFRFIILSILYSRRHYKLLDSNLIFEVKQPLTYLKNQS